VPNISLLSPKSARVLAFLAGTGDLACLKCKINTSTTDGLLLPDN